jgi:hypothetical protein
LSGDQTPADFTWQVLTLCCQAATPLIWLSFVSVDRRKLDREGKAA